MNRTFHALATVLVASSIAAGQQRPPEQNPPAQPVPPVTFKAEVNYVEVDAVVTNAQGSFVSDLTKNDFQVFEDGKPQSVTAFSLVDLPVERAERPLFVKQPIEPDVHSNAQPFDGRLYVIALDDLHTNPLRSSRVKAAAHNFIDRHFGANDLAAVVQTSGRSDAAQEFTNNRRLLLAAIDKFMGRKVRSSTLERLDQAERTRGLRSRDERVTDPLDAERGFDARSALDTLEKLADFMAGIRGRRKALIYISEGIDYDINDVINNRYASNIMDEARETIAAATRANVSIYAVDPRGLTQLGDENIEITGLPADTTDRLGPGSLQDELRLAQDSLRVLADETGGFAAVNSNDFNGAFDRIVRENSSYYVLGYYPTNDKRDGRFRKIEVRLSRPGLQVRARKGYAALKGKPPAAPAGLQGGTPAELREALNSPLQTKNGLTLTVFGAPFKGAAPNASVVLAVQADGRGFTFAEKDGKFVDVMEVSVVATDQQGKVRGGDRQTVNLGLKPETRHRIAETGFRIVSRLDLPAGRYQIRVAARETGGGALGSVYYDLEVPDFSKTDVAMSGVVLASANGAGVPTARAGEIKDLLPVAPMTARDFSVGDELIVFAEVYDNQAAKLHNIDITGSVLTDEGRVVFKNQEQRSSTELSGERGGFGYAARIPLKDMAPGLYVLKVEAVSRLGNGAAASRQVQFRITP